MKWVCIVVFVCALALPAFARAGETPPASAESIPASKLIEPAEFAAKLGSHGDAPLVLQVGSRLLFDQAHIPGAEYVGAAGQEAGLKALAARVEKIDHAQPIVIYCGCCPWPKCPNIRRAYDKLVGMGFTHVQVLHIAENFGADWVDKGYPVGEHAR